jgi:peptidyl-tRNA hydrolase
VIVRQDLPRGIQAAQLIHASGHSARVGLLPEGTYAIALSCRDEGELRTLSERLKAAGLAHHLIHEPDSPYGGALMALGLEPNYKSKFRRYLSNLPLIK